MITFKDIRARHINAVRSRIELKQKMRSVASVFFHAFEDSLALEDKNWSDPHSGNSGTYVSLTQDKSTVGGTRKKNTQVAELEFSASGELSLYITVVLDESPTALPKKHISLPVRLYKKENLIAVLFEGNQKETLVSAKCTSSDFDDVCKMMKEWIIETIEKDISSTQT